MCWGRWALGQLMHVAWGSSQFAWKCAWEVLFLQVGHVRYSVSDVGTYHQPYSCCGRLHFGNRCWGMRMGKELCSMVLRNAISGSVSRHGLHGLCLAILELAFGIRGGLLQRWIWGVGLRDLDVNVGGCWARLVALHRHSLRCRHLLLLLGLCSGWVSFGSMLLRRPG